MRVRSSRTFFLALACTACGTLASPSTGDLDLPASYIGPYQTLSESQTPNGSPQLVSGDAAGETADEPSVIVRAGRRMVYVTLLSPSSVSIGLAREGSGSGDVPPMSLAFRGAQTVFSATQPWEGSYVRAPDARIVDDTRVVLAYECEGGLGIATSDDGVTFAHAAGPALAVGSLDGGLARPVEPTVARAPTGEWFMAFRRGSGIYGARAMDPAGPWTPIPSPLLQPVPSDTPDASTAFDSIFVGDPALTVLQTATGRTLFALFFTAGSAAPNTVIGAAASFDGVAYSRVPRPVYSARNQSLRAGSLDVIDARTALLWVGAGAPTSRNVSAAIGPIVPRVRSPLAP